MAEPRKIISKIGSIFIALLVLPNLFWNTLMTLYVSFGSTEIMSDIDEKISVNWMLHNLGAEGEFRKLFGSVGTNPDYDWMGLFLPALVAFGCIAVAALLLLAAGTIGAAANKHLPALIFCGVSALFACASFIAFQQFSSKVLSPDFQLTDLLGQNIITTLLGGLMKPAVQTCRLGSGSAVLLILAAVLAAWQFIFWRITPQPKPQVLQRPKAPPAPLTDAQMRKRKTT